MVVAGSGERVSSCFIMSHTCSVDEDLADQGSCVHHGEHIFSQQPYVDMLCPSEEAHHLPVKEMAVAQG